MYIIIAAIGKNFELGKNNDLIWNIPSDLKFFKEKTSGKTIVMGRNTFLSLPKILPNRKHIILSDTEIDSVKDEEAITVVTSIEAVDSICNNIGEVYIIGGASIYSQFINKSSKMYLTEIDDTSLDADVFFPKFNKSEWDRKILLEVSENGVNYSHIEYTRK
ncbi:Dihydrofolate reductase [compost metagenome]